MLKRILQLLTLAALVNLAYQHWPRGEADELFLVKNSEWKYGYVDGSGRVRIEFDWDRAFPFDEKGVACVQVGSLRGAINRQGKVVVPVKYDSMLRFDAESHDLALVEKDDLYGYVNREGKEVVPLEWDWLASFDKWGMCEAGKDGLRGVLNTKGQLVIEPVWQRANSFGSQNVAAVKGESGWGMIDRQGNMLVDAKLDFASVDVFGENGLAVVSQEEPVERGSIPPYKGIGWIDQTGKIVIPVEWYEALPFDSSGMAVVCGFDRRWGWIDEHGEPVFPYRWQSVEPFDHHGLARVYSGGQTALIDREGKSVVGFKYSSIGEFDQAGYAIVSDWPGIGGGPFGEEFKPQFKEGLIDKQGNVIFMKEMVELAAFDSNGLAAFKPWGDTPDSVAPEDFEIGGWLDHTGKTVIEIPEGWKANPDAGANFYLIERDIQLTGTRKWMQTVENWLKGDDAEFGLEVVQRRAYNKHGAVIWDSTWLRNTTKSWLYLAATLLPLLIVMWFGRGKKNKLEARTEA